MGSKVWNWGRRNRLLGVREKDYTDMEWRGKKKEEKKENSKVRSLESGGNWYGQNKSKSKVGTHWVRQKSKQIVQEILDMGNLKQHFKEFCEETSLNGWFFIAKDGLSWTRKYIVLCLIWWNGPFHSNIVFSHFRISTCTWILHILYISI